MAVRLPIRRTARTAKDSGPAWANSLFEDNAEYGFGMAVGISQLRKRIAQKMRDAIKQNMMSAQLLNAFKEWIEGKDDAEKSQEATVENASPA